MSAPAITTHRPPAAITTLALHEGTDALTAAREEWDALALSRPSPFLTHAWLAAWATSRARGRLVYAALSDSSGQLRAGALLERVTGGLASAADIHSGDWDAVARTADDRRRLWSELAALDEPRLLLRSLQVGSAEARAAQDAFRARGYGVLEAVRDMRSPYLQLPASFEELLSARSQNLRSQWRRKRRALDRAGRASFRVTTGGPTFERDLDAFLRVEASGWKADEHSAIISDSSTERLYRTFAREAAERDWLRLYLLELDGDVLAADLGCAIGGVGFLLKTGFDQAQSRLSPGLVLRGEVLRASIEEGLHGYDFLGAADSYKLRWTDELRRRQRYRILRGPMGSAAEAPWSGIARPLLVGFREYVLARPELRARLVRDSHTLALAADHARRRLRRVPRRGRVPGWRTDGGSSAR